MQTLVTLVQNARAQVPWLRAHLATSKVIAVRPNLDRARVAAIATLSLVTLLTVAIGSAHAYGPRPVDVNVGGRLVDVQMLVNGEAAPLYTRPGQWDKWYVEAFHGAPYSLRLRNTTGRRVGVLIAVDGLNVVNGERSNLSSREPMYVLDPWESATIRGWRSSLNDIRKFVFVDEQRSYAERTGQANGDMGWIRVLAFEESRPQIRWNDLRPDQDGQRRSREENGELAPQSKDDRGAADEPRANSPAPPADSRGLRKPSTAEKSYAGGAPQADAYPGTGWGDRRNDPVRETHFVAVARATDKIVLRYEYEDGLRALGIDPRHDRLRDRENGTLGFAKPPRW